MEHRATYSPEDNKLRLYPAYRLDSDEYAKVKAAGFSWAPKQELFVAPSWTPYREDFLATMVEEIEDEDTSLVERAETKAERLEDLSDRKAQQAEQARAAVDAIAGGIPFGRPILVGHHSEKKARKDAEKIENGMRKAVANWKASEYWQERAQGAIRHAKYKERPDVRARRIKGLEADKRKQEKSKTEAEMFLRLWSNDCAAVRAKDPTQTLTFLQRARFVAARDRVSREFPISEYPRPEGASKYEGSMSLWSALGDGDKEIGFITPEQARDFAVKVHNRTVAYAERWIDHLDNRLAYERAMLEDAGGLATDRKGPEVGGAVRVSLWSPGNGQGFAYIRKVNKVTVSIDHKWNRDSDGPHPVKVSFDEIKAVMTKAEVEQARADGRLMESGDGCGFFLTDAPAPAPRPVEENPAHAEHFEAMQEQLRNGGVKVVSAPQLFPTPPDLARRMAELADLTANCEVLEPSAGTGNLCKAITDAGAKVFAVEINYSLAEQLSQRITPSEDAAQGICRNVLQGDFLEQNGNLGKFDAVLMNPPFENGADIKHIKHALTFLKPGGRLVAICAGGSRQERELKPIVEEHGGEWEPLPAGTFKDQGTGVSTVLLSLTVQ